MKAVFLDKDGTLVEDVPYNVDPEKIQFCEGVLAGLQRLHQAGYQLVVVSNQSGVARGIFPETALTGVRDWLAVQFESAAQAPLTGFYYCPHHPDGQVANYTLECDCRKPAPGLILRAACELGINLEQSWMIGDILHDVEAGHRAGCRSILIDKGNETEWELQPVRLPDYVVNNFLEAVDIITRVHSPVY